MDIKEIRRRNLQRLIDEAGSRKEVCRRTGISYYYLNQIFTGQTGKNGKPRGIGSKSARSIEKGMGRQYGWLDILHDESPKESNGKSINRAILSKAVNFIDLHAPDYYYNASLSNKVDIVSFLYELFTDRHAGNLNPNTVLRLLKAHTEKNTHSRNEDDRSKPKISKSA